MDKHLSELSVEFSTLVELVRWRALRQPEQQAYTFLLDGEVEDSYLTYAQLDCQARAIGALLQSCVRSGERALLLYPPGLEYIAAFFGCLYAGVVAVPAYPPRPNRSMSRLQAIIADAQATVALTTTSVLSDVERRFVQAPDLKALHWLTTGNVTSDLADEWQEPDVSSDTLAFLQYTSGSTGTPKGVMVSHGNLLHNSAYIKHSFELTPKSVSVTWLPSFHDMGLIDGIIQPLYTGFLSVLMPPVSFLQRPIRWLQAISHYKATHCGGPNFAYDLCVRQITSEQRETLDLSSWCTAYNGAEPVRQETLERFAAAFKTCGFRASFFYPCYGMAEATLMVSGGLVTDEPVFCTVQADALEKNRVVEASVDAQSVRQLVGSGRARLDTKIVIADPESLTQCAPDEVGEIWVSSSSVAQGYWRRPEQTECTFRAYLAETGVSEAGRSQGPFLRTGDLGFLKDGELFVTGRLKDLIIIRGRNHYPQDIELTVEQSHPALRPGCGAAFSVDVLGEERLVVAQEVERQYLRNLDVDAVVRNICQAVVEQHELEVYAILLLKTASIPKTSSGKIQRRACRAGFLAGSLDVVRDWSTNPQTKVEFRHLMAEVETLEQQLQTRKQQQAGSGRNNASKQASFKNEFHKAQAIQAWVISKIAQRLGVNPDDIDVREPFARYGLDSVAAVSLSGELENWLGRRLSPTLVYDYPTIAALVRHLAEEPDASGATFKMDALRKTETEEIAIIGLGCHFPGAKDPEAFWQLLRSGVDAITEVPVARWDIDTFYDSNPTAIGKMNTRWGGFLEQVDQFDPHFFGIAPREAERMDPQQRLLLEVAWEALENAGIAQDKLAGSKTGVFIGISSSDYSRFQFEDYSRIDAYAGTGNALSIAANRLSYVMDLRGPSVAVDTACSSSLVAVHLACQSLRHGECHMALVGGVNLILSPELTITFSQARMMAADGRCKTFDAAADGYVRGEGCGLVILKRLSDAVRDCDNILAVIRGSAINQDGRSNGLTAPNGPSQQAVIRQALENAGVAPGEISYVEAHGTGTPLGDPIEVESLLAVLLPDRAPDQPCALGAVKSNIGHLEAAAGIASLIKVVLCLQHGEIPPQLHLNQLNPHISLSGTPFSIPKSRQPWSPGSRRRFSGVSSFSFGGTNAHVVMEESPVPTPAAISVERPLHLLTLSAKSESALQSLARRYLAFLESQTQASLADICFTANTGRSHLAHRLAVATESTVELREQLGAFASGQQISGLVNGIVHSSNRPKLAFLFSGQGSQYPDMGLKLYETQPTFRQALSRCEELLRPYLEQPLLTLLYPGPDATELLQETAYTQPALFALEYALAELWRSWGIVPDAVMGHSVGEYVAACVAGVFSLEDALKLVALRSRLMQSLPQSGEMAVVFADENRVATAIAAYQAVAIAAVNGPENIVISGVREAVQAVVEQFQSEGIAVCGLKVSHAFHSPLMDPILDEFERHARQVEFKAPRIALISNLTGQMLHPGEIPDARYWRRHMREAVQFQAGMHTLAEQGYDLFVELGAQPTLLGMGKRCLPQGSGTWLASLKQDQSDWQMLLNSVGALYVNGVDVDWAGFERDYARCRIPLPTYPWQRQRYWLSESPVRQLQPQSQELALWSSVVAAGQQQSQQGPLDLVVHTHPAKLRCLDSLTSAYIIGALKQLGAYTQTGERHTVDQLLQQFKISSIHRKLLCGWLERLAQQGILQQQSQTFVSPLPLPEASAASMMGEARKQWPDAAHILDFMQRCGENLAAVLVGEVNPVDLLFPGGAFETAQGIYQHAPEARYFNGIARSVLEAVVKTLPQSRQLRILEIGAGTGGTTAELLPVLPADRTLYCYTDLSDLFLARAKQKFKTYPFVRYQLLNIELNPIEQGYSDHSFDVVVAANVLYATRNLGETLEHVRSVLAPNGVLLIWEVTQPQSWLDITFALFDGWQRYDDQLRQDQPLLSRQQWDTVLRSHGFCEVVAFPDLGSAAEVLSQHILVARAPAAVAPWSGDAAAEVLARRHQLLKHDPERGMPENLDDWLYELKWQPQALSPGQRDLSPTLPGGRGTWLIFADGVGVGQQLAGLLTQGGERCVLVFPSEAYECIDSGHFRIHPERPSDMRQLLQTALGAQPACRGVVHLWSLDALSAQQTTVAALETAQTLGCGSVVHLVQELERAGWGETVRLWLVTRGSQMVSQQPVTIAVAQAPLWGLGRTIFQEHPALWGGLVDLDPQAPVHDASAQLWSEICRPDGEDQLAFRQGQRYVARLVRQHESTRAAAPVEWRSDGSYLITGGLGDLGLLVAHWMVEQGAKRLILLGRTRLPERTNWDQVEKGSRLAGQIAAIRELESLGASVDFAAVDVASENQLNSFIEAFHRSGWPPIRGVVHAAGLVQDRTLQQLDSAALNTVLRPKVVGGWLLHRLLSDAPLDFFVLFSSVSSLLAQPGQGNYAAANAFLDALAHQRRTEGRPALSINWGVWAALGFATTPGGRRLAKHLARLGIGSMEPSRGLELLGGLIGRGCAQVAVMPVNWSQLGDFYPQARKLPLLSHLLRQEVDGLPEAARHNGKGRLTPDVLLAAEPGECQRLLESYLGSQVARVLGLTASELDVQQPLNNLGLDSLMAVELKNLIESDLGVVVPVANFLQGPSVTQLATQMVEQLTTAASTLENSSVVELALPVTQSESEQKDSWLNLMVRENTEGVLANLDHLDDEAVDSLLGSILAEEEVQERE